MFSGIVEATVPITRVVARGSCRRVSIRLPRGWKLALGESVNIDGICSTVVDRGRQSFEVEFMPQTLRLTTATEFVPKRILNLERSLVWGGRVSGHFVSGHVDARGKVTRVQKKGRSRTLTIKVPRTLLKLIAARGSIAINGVSLTVAGLRKGEVEIALIPHTLRATNLGSLKDGDAVNIECDMLARLPKRSYQGKTRNATVRHHAKKRIHSKTRGR